MREYLAFVMKPSLRDKRAQMNGPGKIIHATNAELALQEAKMHIPLKVGEVIAIAFIKNLTPQDVPDRYVPCREPVSVTLAELGIHL